MARSTRDKNNPVSIEKRYSEFETLHRNLKKSYPDVMQDVSFPRKQLSGNFSAKTIAERSRAFELYLCHLVMNHEVRMSHPFAPFFYEKEWQNACELFQSNRYEAAIVILRRVLDIQRKLLTDIHASTIHTLCLIAVCYMRCRNELQCYLSSRIAIKSIHTDDSSEYLRPLLECSIRMAWSLGFEKQDLEERLSALNKSRHQQQCLEELVVKLVDSALQPGS